MADLNQNSPPKKQSTGYYDAEGADKCVKIAAQHQDFYTDLEERYQKRQEVQEQAVQKISDFKSQVNPKISKHTASFDEID